MAQNYSFGSIPSVREVDNAFVREEDLQVKAKDAKRKRAINLVLLSTFLSTNQHMCAVMSEPMLVRSVAGGEAAAAARLLGNTSAVVGLLSLIIYQAGGKLSDSIGRKPCFLVGPVNNIICGLLVYTFHRSKAVVLACRVLRMVLTTFSSTVTCHATLADVCDSTDLGAALSRVNAVTGLCTITASFWEARTLRRSNNNLRYAYLTLAGLGATQLTVMATQFEETLDAAKRAIPQLNMSLINPFGFTRIFTHGSSVLKRMTFITTFQMFLEGRNMSDISQIWYREHLRWDTTMISRVLTTYGVAVMASGAYLTPMLLKKLSVVNFTSFTNVTLFLGFVMRGLRENGWLFMSSIMFLLPGVNGASTYALKALQNQHAIAAGFGKGEFSAWVNNMRAIACAIAPWLYGNFYSICRKRKFPPGMVFMLAAVIGAALPELLLRSLPQHLKPPQAKLTIDMANPQTPEDSEMAKPEGSEESAEEEEPKNIKCQPSSPISPVRFRACSA